MKKLADPFELLPENNTPIHFAVCAQKAVKWLITYLDCNGASHIKFVIDCERYFDLIDELGTDLDITLTRQQADMIESLQARIYEQFQKIWRKTVQEEMIRMTLKQSKAQSDRASKPRKEATEDWESLAKSYIHLKESGMGHKLIGELAKKKKVTTQTLRNLAKKYKAQQKAK